jgi:hypothetical protein
MQTFRFFCDGDVAQGRVQGYRGVAAQVEFESIFLRRFII